MNLADESRNRRGCRKGLDDVAVSVAGRPGVFPVQDSRWAPDGELEVAVVLGGGLDATDHILGRVSWIPAHACELRSSWPCRCCRARKPNAFNRARGPIP